MQERLVRAMTYEMWKAIHNMYDIALGVLTILHICYRLWAAPGFGNRGPLGWQILSMDQLFCFFTGIKGVNKESSTSTSALMPRFPASEWIMGGALFGGERGVGVKEAIFVPILTSSYPHRQQEGGSGYRYTEWKREKRTRLLRARSM